MTRLVSIFTFVLLTSLTCEAKLILIQIKEVLQNAKTIRSVVILGYRDSTMLYRFDNSKDTLSIGCKTKPYSESFRQSLIKSKYMRETDLAGKWPTAGQQVIIVINKNSKVSLFATTKGDEYRFWDPNSVAFANSAFAIPKESLFKPLVNCKDSPGDPHYWICTDGCLMIAKYLKERG